MHISLAKKQHPRFRDDGPKVTIGNVRVNARLDKVQKLDADLGHAYLQKHGIRPKARLQNHWLDEG